ncbi:MAG: Bifunctional protein FolD [Parcubacteria group bacterium GW2011_GWC1_45_13]|nr:MAG: Bifunctional protein FolD [Parcubacteria group bacterium GW2011_GWC1_45_13]
MPIIDGKKLAEEIKAELKTEVLGLNKKIRLAVIKVGKNPVTEKFLEQKKKFGEAVGIDVRIYDLQETISTNQLREKLAEIVHIKENTGVIIQLPLPKQALFRKKTPICFLQKALVYFRPEEARFYLLLSGRLNIFLIKIMLMRKAKMLPYSELGDWWENPLPFGL